MVKTFAWLNGTGNINHRISDAYNTRSLSIVKTTTFFPPDLITTLQCLRL